VNKHGRMKSIRIKVLSIGNTETGKSCLIKRYCEKRFVNKYLPTIGVDFGVSNINIDDKELKVNLFDLSGHAAFKEVRNEFYKDTQAVMLVYDVTKQHTLDALDSWMNEIKSYIINPKDVEKIIFMVLANKTDKSDRCVKHDHGKLWAQKNGCYYFETSANTGDGVTKAFQMMFKAVIEVLDTGLRPKSAGITLGYTKEQVDVIRKLQNAKDHYGCLDVHRHCSKEDVTKSYRRLAKLIHPDKCTAPGTEDAFKKLTTAREELIKLFK